MLGREFPLYFYCLFLGGRTERHLPAFSCMTGAQWAPFCRIFTLNVSSNATDEKLGTFLAMVRKDLVGQIFQAENHDRI